MATGQRVQQMTEMEMKLAAFTFQELNTRKLPTVKTKPQLRRNKSMAYFLYPMSYLLYVQILILLLIFSFSMLYLAAVTQFPH